MLRCREEKGLRLHQTSSDQILSGAQGAILSHPEAVLKDFLLLHLPVPDPIVAVAAAADHTVVAVPTQAPPDLPVQDRRVAAVAEAVAAAVAAAAEEGNPAYNKISTTTITFILNKRVQG
jgi:hypothetical protein